MNKNKYENEKTLSMFLLRTKVNGWIYTNSVPILGLAKKKENKSKYYTLIFFHKRQNNIIDDILIML